MQKRLLRNKLKPVAPRVAATELSFVDSSFTGKFDLVKFTYLESLTDCRYPRYSNSIHVTSV